MSTSDPDHPAHAVKAVLSLIGLPRREFRCECCQDSGEIGRAGLICPACNEGSDEGDDC